MKLDDLEALGATVTCGNVDINNVYVGKLLKDGDVLLSADGEAVVAELMAAQEAKPVAAKAGKAAKAAKAAQEDAPQAGAEG